MGYRVVCDSCAFDRETDDWIMAHELARDHEAEHSSHWVELRDLG